MPRSFEKKPLYRKVNTKTHGVWHGNGGEFKWQRNSKSAARDSNSRGSMHGKGRQGRDYAPLFRFLLSKVGCDWNEVHSEALSRLDSEEPIYRMVARNDTEKREQFGIAESTYFSGLYIDADNQLALVNPDLRVEDMEPSCPCCTHTFNGEPFIKKFPSVWDNPPASTSGQSE